MPRDPRCPQCGGKIGARAQWCMHCGAEFGEGGRGPVEGDSGADPADALLAGDLPAFAAHLDDDGQLRSVVVIAFGLLTWYLVSAVVWPGLTALPTAAVALLVVLALLTVQDGRELLVRGLYYSATALVGARVLVPLLFAAGTPVSGPALFLAFLHVPTLVAAGALFYAGRWVATRTREGSYPHPHPT